MRHDPYLVSKVTAADGRVIYDHGTTTGQQAVPQQVARNVTEAMIQVAPSAGDRARGPRGGRQDRHRAAPDAERAEQGRLDGRLHPVGVHGGLGRHRQERSDQERGRAARVRPDAARIDLADLHERRPATAEQFSPFVPLGTPLGVGTDESDKSDDEDSDDEKSDDEDKDDDDSDRNSGDSDRGSDGSGDSDSSGDSGNRSDSGNDSSNDSSNSGEDFSDDNTVFEEPRIDVPGFRSSNAPVLRTSGQQPLAAGAG